MNESFISEFYIASCTQDGGVTRFGLAEDGTLTKTGWIGMVSPMWTEIIRDADGKPERIAAAVRDAEKGETYAEYRIADGEKVFSPIPTLGKEFCHFAIDGEDIWCANYSTGSVMHIHGTETKLIEHLVPRDGELGPDAGRQERPHCHQCILSPDKRFVLVCDLGLDSVFVYDRDLNKVSTAKVPAGHGARHSVFSLDGKKLWTLAEMGSSVTEFDWDAENGVLTYVETVSVRPKHDGLTDAASIVLSPDGEHLYCSNRGTAHTVAHLTTRGGLKLVSQIPSGGLHPRAMGLVAGGRVLVVCNTFSDNVTLFRVKEDGELALLSSYNVPRPLCVNEI